MPRRRVAAAAHALVRGHVPAEPDPLGTGREAVHDSIGFDAATIGVMAAVYSVVVPLLEIPSGILADRWSRRGVLLIATGALVVSVAIGGLSQNVVTYLVSALFLGVFFAMQSGTADSIVYDTVVDETGNSD